MRSDKYDWNDDDDDLDEDIIDDDDDDEESEKEGEHRAYAASLARDNDHLRSQVRELTMDNSLYQMKLEYGTPEFWEEQAKLPWWHDIKHRVPGWDDYERIKDLEEVALKAGLERINPTKMEGPSS